MRSTERAAVNFELGVGRRRDAGKRVSRWGLWAAAVLFAAAFGPHGRAWAAEPAVGIRSLAMGDTMRAAATGAEGALLNPSGIAVSKMFAASAFYSLRVQSLGHTAHASISDSLMQKWLALGLYYNFLYESPSFSYRLAEGGTSSRIVLVQNTSIVRTGNEAGIVVAVPLTDRLSLGGTVKYANYSLTSQLTSDVVPSDFTYANQAIDNDHKVDLGSIGNVVTFDFGITARIVNQLRLGVVGQNLWPHGVELPARLGIGLSFRPSSRWLLASDAVIDFTGNVLCTGMPPDPCSTTQNRITVRWGLGAEYIIADIVPLRAGYLYDSNLDAHHISAGLGYINSEHGFGLDFAMRQRVKGGDETVLLLGLRLVKE